MSSRRPASTSLQPPSLTILFATLTPLFLKHTKLQAHSQLRAFAMSTVASDSRASHDCHLDIQVSAQMHTQVMPSLTILINFKLAIVNTLPYFLQHISPCEISDCYLWTVYCLSPTTGKHRYHESRDFMSCSVLYPQHQGLPDSSVGSESASIMWDSSLIPWSEYPLSRS